MRFIRRANSTRFVRLYILGVDGSIWRPGPATPLCAVMPLPIIELMPFLPRTLILVLGEAEEVLRILFLSLHEFYLCTPS